MAIPLIRNRKTRRTLQSLRGKNSVKIDTDYDTLVKSVAALDKVGKLKGLSGQDKMFFAKLRRLLHVDINDIEEQRVALAKKYLEKGHERLKKEITDRAAAMPDGPKKDQTLAAAKKVAKPNQVLQPEMPDYQIEYEALLKAKVQVDVSKIPLSKLVDEESILPEDLFALDWLTDDDVSDGPKAKRKTKGAQETTEGS